MKSLHPGLWKSLEPLGVEKSFEEGEKSSLFGKLLSPPLFFKPADVTHSHTDDEVHHYHGDEQDKCGEHESSDNGEEIPTRRTVKHVLVVELYHHHDHLDDRLKHVPERPSCLEEDQETKSEANYQERKRCQNLKSMEVQMY